MSSPVAMCSHPKAKRFRGLDVSRVYGTWRSEECGVCGKIRLMDHYDRIQDGKWIDRPVESEDSYQ